MSPIPLTGAVYLSELYFADTRAKHMSLSLLASGQFAVLTEGNPVNKFRLHEINVPVAPYLLITHKDTIQKSHTHNYSPTASEHYMR
jgi:hypothetical protein